MRLQASSITRTSSRRIRCPLLSGSPLPCPADAPGRARLPACRARAVRVRRAPPRAVLAGDVHVGPGRARAAKPSQLVDPTTRLAVEPPPYVSRGGDQARQRARRPRGRRRGAALDVGASTGGFTDCLLQRGAEHVVARRRRLRRARLALREDLRVPARAHQRPRAVARGLAVAPDLVVARRLVHLAGQVLPRADLRRAALRRRWPWSSRSSRSAASSSGRAASCAIRRGARPPPWRGPREAGYAVSASRPPAAGPEGQP